MSWSNEKEAYDDGFDDGVCVATGVSVSIIWLALVALLFMRVVGVI